MPTPNTSGKPNTQDYSIGRGKLYLGQLDATTGLVDTNGWRDLGNCPEFTVTATEEALDHFSSQSGLKLKDLSVVISQELSGTFQLDEINAENLAYLMNGNQSTPANVATSTAVVISSSVKLGRWYELVDNNGVRMYDLDTSATFTLAEDPTGTPTALVEGTDYELDTEMGLVLILEGATNIADGEAFGIQTITGGSAVATVDQIDVFKASDPRFAMKFVAENPVRDNKKAEYQFHQVRLKANGDLSLIGDDWTTLPFAFTAEKNINGDTAKITTHDQA